MCSRVNCSACGKPTFAGCGAHVENVLGDVPKDKRCRCREQPADAKAGQQPPSILRRLWGP